MEGYKTAYNKLLKRYYNGIEYILQNPNEREKWLPEILKIMKNLSDMIIKYSIPEEKILTGFEVK